RGTGTWMCWSALPYPVRCIAHIGDGGAATAIVSLVSIATIQPPGRPCPTVCALSLVLLRFLWLKTSPEGEDMKLPCGGSLRCPTVPSCLKDRTSGPGRSAGGPTGFSGGGRGSCASKTDGAQGSARYRPRTHRCVHHTRGRPTERSVPRSPAR